MTEAERELEHGTGGYRRGCRCDGCREGWRVYKSDLRRRQGVQPRVEWLAAAREKKQHGTRARYRKGCRCEPCRAAERTYRAIYRRRAS